MAAMKENSVKTLNYLKEVHGQNVTAADVAAGTDLTAKQINAIFNAFVKKGLGVRSEPVTVEIDGETKDVKFLSLTDAGMAFVPGVSDAE